MSNTKGKHIFHYDSVRKLLDTPSYYVGSCYHSGVRPGVAYEGDGGSIYGGNWDYIK